MKSLLSAIALLIVVGASPAFGITREGEGYLKTASAKQIEEQKKREKRDRAERSAQKAKRWKNYNRQMDVLERSAILIDYERALRAHHLSSIGEFAAADALLLRRIDLLLANQLAEHVPAQRAEGLKKAGKKIDAGRKSIERVLDSLCDVDSNLQSAVSRGDRQKVRKIFHKRRHNSMHPWEYLKDVFVPEFGDVGTVDTNPEGPARPGVAPYEWYTRLYALFKPVLEGILNEYCEGAMNDRIKEDKREREQAAREAASRGSTGRFSEGTSPAERRSLGRSSNGGTKGSGSEKAYDCGPADLCFRFGG